MSTIKMAQLVITNDETLVVASNELEPSDLMQASAKLIDMLIEMTDETVAIEFLSRTQSFIETGHTGIDDYDD